MKIEGEIIVTENNIIKVNHVTETEIIGFDIITQSCIIISVTDKFLVSPKSILPLVEKEKARFHFINAMFPDASANEKSKRIGIAPRTYFRIQNGIEQNLQYRYIYKN